MNNILIRPSLPLLAWDEPGTMNWRCHADPPCVISGTLPSVDGVRPFSPCLPSRPATYSLPRMRFAFRSWHRLDQNPQSPALLLRWRRLLHLWSRCNGRPSSSPVEDCCPLPRIPTSCNPQRELGPSTQGIPYPYVHTYLPTYLGSIERWTWRKLCLLH
ncbi:hypothetical protein LX32DRAFT_309866 [Colletotrichum zoysiae]|uniref:Uncharacterized protein n=1 Tax=Colletotrichum zoysiae TaxID=1216348 RepID=A0AAD9HVE4_9PEZI|nr:hypothetical protein LX32DRAFT_309866 [Colletotrichum zoysiae]